jgi:hypothetical protein
MDRLLNSQATSTRSGITAVVFRGKTMDIKRGAQIYVNRLFLSLERSCEGIG